jgi:8-oxo-dGTP diphosphatase
MTRATYSKALLEVGPSWFVGGVESPHARSTVVVSAAIIVEAGKVLLTQRKRGAHLEGAWEFPGGKVEQDEDPREALVRELAEEIGASAIVGDIVEVTFHRYPTKSVLLLFYEARIAADSPAPVAIDVAALRWAAASDLRDEEFPPADVAVLAKVRTMLGDAKR